MKTVALIMAGGIGERFWPLSSKKNPKQILSIFTDKPMIRETFDRINALINVDKIFIATNAIQVDYISEIIPEIPTSNFIIEPAFRDTAAAIGYSMIYINSIYPNSILSVFPSDHIIRDLQKFLRTFENAINVVNDKNIITFGIVPSNPNTNYGYIQTDEYTVGHINDVYKFKEKPNEQLAKEYFYSGQYLWNAGIFIFTINHMLKLYKKYQHDHYRILMSIQKNKNSKHLFYEFKKLSFDVAILEKAKNIKVIPVDFDWHDIGNYNALYEIFEADDNNNIVLNTMNYSISSKDNIIIGENKVIGTIGLNNHIIVNHNNKLLIVDREQVHLMKELLKLMNEEDK